MSHPPEDVLQFVIDKLTACGYSYSQEIRSHCTRVKSGGAIGVIHSTGTFQVQGKTGPQMDAMIEIKKQLEDAGSGAMLGQSVISRRDLEQENLRCQIAQLERTIEAQRQQIVTQQEMIALLKERR